MTHVIHFADLEDMITELNPIEKVRLAKMKTVEGQDKLGVIYEVIGLHLRQIQGDTVLSWMYPAARYRTSRGEPLEPEDKELQENGWQYVAHIEELVANRLLDEDTFKIRPGLIDLQGTVPLAGYWSLLDDQNEDEDQPE